MKQLSYVFSLLLLGLFATSTLQAQSSANCEPKDCEKICAAKMASTKSCVAAKAQATTAKTVSQKMANCQPCPPECRSAKYDKSKCTKANAVKVASFDFTQPLKVGKKEKQSCVPKSCTPKKAVTAKSSL